jgi:hypothetical protein
MQPTVLTRFCSLAVSLMFIGKWVDSVKTTGFDKWPGFDIVGAE